MEKKIKNRYLCEVLRNVECGFNINSCKSRNALAAHLRNTFGNQWDSDEEFDKNLKGKIEGFCYSLSKNHHHHHAK